MFLAWIDVLYTIAVLDKCVWSSYLSIYCSDTGFQCISLRDLTCKSMYAAQAEKGHIVFHRTVAELGRDDFQ